MILLNRVLGEGDVGHIRSILGDTREGGAGPDPAGEKVRRFLEERAFISRGAEPAFRALPQADRERVISDLVWRITCHLEGSVTRVVGVDTFDLGSGFCAILSEREGRDIFCLALSRPS